MSPSMRANTREQQMASIVAMTHAMQEHAAGDRWDEVGDVHERREQLLWEFFSVPVTASESAWIQAALEQLLNMDRDMQTRCRAQMEDISGQLRGLAHGRDASTAYQSFSE